MGRTLTALAAIALIAGIVPAYAQNDGNQRAKPEEYALDLARPGDSELASFHDLRYRLSGSLLGGWFVDAEEGTSILYVVAQEHEQELPVQLAATNVAQSLVNLGLQPRLNDSMTALGQPAFALSVEGPGYGTSLDRVGGSPAGGNVPTYMRVVGIPVPLQNSETRNHLLLFVAIAPVEALDPCRAAMEELLTGSTLGAAPQASETAASPTPTPTPAPASPPPTASPPAPEQEASVQFTEPGSPDGFFLKIAEPDGWKSADASEIPDRVDGRFLAGWTRASDQGKAAIYVLGRRAQGKFIVGQLGESMQASFSDSGLEADLEADLTVLGRPAFMLSVWGKGTGLSLNAYADEGSRGNAPTFLRLITLVNPWQGEVDGVDFIKFVAVGPLKAVTECLASFGDVVEKSDIHGSYSPPAPAQPAVAETPPEPAPEPVQSEVIDLGTDVFGSIYTLGSGGVSMRSLHILRAVDDGGVDAWTVPADVSPEAIVLLISSDGMKAWALSGADTKSAGKAQDGGGIRLTDGDALIPFRANWDELLR